MTAEILLLRFLALLFSFGIFTQAFALRSKHGSWLSPPAIFAVYWGLMTIIPIALVQDAAPVAGAFVAFVMVSMFSIGSLVVPTGHIDPLPQRVGLYDTKLLYWALTGTALFALVCLLINSSVQGISLDRLFTFEAAAEYTENRYSGDLVSNIFIQMATVLSYVAAVICGLLLGNAGKKRPLVIFLGLAPTLFVLVTQSAKGALLLSAALIAAGHFVRAIDARETRFISQKSARRLLIYVLAILPLLIISFMARGLYGSISASELSFQLYRYLLSYTSGHLFAFTDWMQHYWGYGSSLFYGDPGTNTGFYTFMSVARALGDMTVVPPGTYDEYYSHSAVLETNIYTMFRGLIVDFTFVGAMLFMMLSGLLAKAAYRVMTQPKFSAFAAVCFIVFIAATQQSTYISLFQYNSAYVFGAILWVMLSVNHGIWAGRITRSGHGPGVAPAAY